MCPCPRRSCLVWYHTIANDPGRTRTCNPWLRRPMPYPLGHGAFCELSKIIHISCKKLFLSFRTHFSMLLGLLPSFFFCVSWCVLPGCLYLRAFGQSAPDKPTKQTSLVCLIAIFISSKAGSCVLSLEGVALCGTIP